MHTLKTEYLKRALAISPSAVDLVREFFDDGVADNLTVIYGSLWGVGIGSFEWSTADLDRALDAMEMNNE